MVPRPPEVPPVISTETPGNIRREPEAATTALDGLAMLVNSTLDREGLWTAHNYEPPLPETAAFSGEPEQYVALVRTAAARRGPDIYDLLVAQKQDPRRCLSGQERKHIGQLVTEYLLAQSVVLEDIGSSGDIKSQHITGQLQGHVQGVASVPRLFMYEKYNLERTLLAQKFFPPSGDFEVYLRGDKLLSAHQMEIYARSVQNIAYAPPLPDLLRLPIAQQQDIIRVLAGEYLALCQLVASDSPDFLAKLPPPDTQAYSPLLTMSVEDVKRMIDKHQTVKATQLYAALWQYPQTLSQKIAKLEEGSERARLRAFQSYTGDYKALLSAVRINKDIRRLSPGTVLLLSPPLTELSARDVLDILNDHLRLLAYEQYTTRVEASRARAYAPQIKIAMLEGKFARPRSEAYTDVCLTELPLDAERLAALPKRYAAADPMSFRRIGVDFRDTKHLDRVNCYELLLYLETNDTRPPVTWAIYETLPTTSLSVKELQNLIDDSRERAIARYHKAIARPYIQNLPPGIESR